MVEKQIQIYFYFSHASPFYLAYRGQCLCYSGEFICSKHDTAKGSKKGGAKIQGKFPPKDHIYTEAGIFIIWQYFETQFQISFCIAL